MVSNNCQSSLKLQLVSKPDIFLEQTKTNALENFIGTCSWRAGKSLRLADNIDLIAVSKYKLTYLTSRLTYQNIYFAWK